MAKNSALPLIAGGAALLLLSSGGKKKRGSASRSSKWGVRVSSDCSDAKIVDPELFYKFAHGAFHELADADPTLTLMQFSDALFYELAPNCTGYPHEPESASIADLYATITRLVGQLMVSDSRFQNMPSVGALVSEASQIGFSDWYRKWHNYPSPELPTAPASEVSFSSDLTRYQIGSDWYEETVVPFVAESASEDRLGSVMQDFMDNRGVVFGRRVVPISELPTSAVAVKSFLNSLEEAIQEAKEEVGS